MHIAHLRQVLTLLRNSGFTLKVKKCAFFVTVNYCGYIMLSARLELSEAIAAAVRELKDCATQTEVRCYHGLCNLFRGTVLNFSAVAAPLNIELPKNQRTTFPSPTEAEKYAVENLGTLLTNPAVLPLPRTTGQYMVDTYACDSQVGFILLQQEKESTARPIMYCSRKRTSAKYKH